MGETIRMALGFCMLVVAIVSAPAHARASELMAACKGEIAANCRDVSKGRGRITACLFSRNHTLSSECNSAVTKASKRVPGSVLSMKGTKHEVGLRNACRADVRRLCSNARSGTQYLLACLYSRSRNVSKPCMDEAKSVLGKVW